MYSFSNRLLDLYMEECNLDLKRDVVITACRRSGKTTLLRHLAAAYLEDMKKSDILFIAPQKKFKLMNFTPYVTAKSIKGLNPKIILVDEAAYCKKSVLEVAQSLKQSPNYIKTIYITTPKIVTYKKNKKGILVSDCWLKDFIDKNKKTIKLRHFGLETSYDAAYKKLILKDKDKFTEEQWETEYEAKWVCKYE